MESKRLTAIKVPVIDIVEGDYHKQEGFDPNFIIAKNSMKLSRVRVMGTIVNKYTSPDDRFASLTLDDGTATVRAKAFANTRIFSNVYVGDVVDVIGKVRLYEDEIHLVAEIAQKMTDPNYEILRRLELMLQEREWSEKKKKLLDLGSQTTDLSELKQVAFNQLELPSEVVESVMSSLPAAAAEEEKDSKDGKDEIKKKMLSLITECDRGDGCSYNDLVKVSGVDEYVVESVISELLEDGECFEPKPGKIKRL